MPQDSILSCSDIIWHAMSLIEAKAQDIPANATTGEFALIHYAPNLLSEENFQELLKLNDCYISFSIHEHDDDLDFYFADCVRHQTLKTLITGNPNLPDKNWHHGQLGLTEGKICSAQFHSLPSEERSRVETVAKALLKRIDPAFIEKPCIPVKFGEISYTTLYRYFPTLKRLKSQPHTADYFAKVKKNTEVINKVSSDIA